MNKIVHGENWISWTYFGEVPEKEFILYGKAGNIKQKEGLHDWQKQFGEAFSNENNGYTVATEGGDMTLQEYTPLRVKYEIFSPEMGSMIKKIKTINDALNGRAWADDCSIVEIYAASQYSDTPRVNIQIRPADYETISMPTTEPIKIERVISSIKTHAFDNETGAPLNPAEYEKDQNARREILQEVTEQQSEKIKGNYSLHGFFAQKDINIRQPLSAKLYQLSGKVFPIMTPDLDNVAYGLLSALNGEIVDIDKLRRLHIVRTYYNTTQPRNKIWLCKD